MKKNLFNETCIAREGLTETPVCQDCLSKEVEGWLKKRRPRLILSLRRKTRQFVKLTDYTNKNLCIYCKEKLNACAFCYIHFIEDWIRRKYPRLLWEFKLYFNFG